jgi:hypothetical protein
VKTTKKNKKKKRQQREKHMKLQSSLVALLIMSAVQAWCDSYSVQVQPRTYFPVAWSFQDSTVASAFPNPDEGTRLLFWNPDLQSWSVVEFDLGVWSNPSHVIKNGTGFYYFNPTDQVKELVVSGSVLAQHQKAFNYVGGKMYLIGYAYLQPDPGINCVECISRPYGEPYMEYSLFGESFMENDVIYTWNPESLVWSYAIKKPTSTNCSDCPGGSAYWEGAQACRWSPGCYLSPQVPRGHAFWFKPATYRTLIHKSDPVSDYSCD